MTEPTAGMGARITQARQAKGYSLNKLAQTLGLHADTLSDWEHDRTEPRANRLIMLAGVLNVSPGWLLEGSADFAPEPATPGAERAALKAELAEIRRTIAGMVERLESVEERLG